jgi:mycothiol synthase
MTELLPPPPVIPGITWRPPRKEDAAGIAALQDAVFEVDDGWREVESEILDRWKSDYCVVGDDSLIAVDDRGEIVASVWSYVPSVAESKWRAFHDNYVRPDHRTPLLQEFVLEWWEARCRQRFVGKDDELPRLLWRDAYDWQEDKIAFLEAHGYEPMRYYDELLADLSDPIVDRPLPEGLSIASWESAPLDDSHSVHNAAFADHWGSQPQSGKAWAQNVNDFLLPRASYVVYDQDEPVAYLMAAAYPHDFDDKGRREAWIEGLGTLRAYRRKGIGSALVTLAMKEFASMEMEFAILGVDSENPTGAYGVYQALGFEPDRRSVAYIKDLSKES